MEDYYEYLDSNGVTTLYKLIKDDTVALVDSYSVTINGITTTLDNHVNNMDIHTPISDIESMVDTKIAGLVNSAPETLDTLKELSDALGNDPNFATTVANQIGSKASKDDVYTKQETDTLLENKANKSDLSTVATSGSYKDLLDKPVIPEGADLSGYYNKGETDNLLNSKANTSDLAVVAKSGNYNDLVDTPTIPSKTSDLTNDSGYITNVAWEDVTDKPILSAVAISGNYNDLSNKPTIPTVNNATLTIQKNGTIVNTFTANSSKNVTANITVPTKTSDLTNDSGYITSVSWSDITNKPNFATVATSGSYNDLSNKPTIPNVYNKTLTIQKNGTNVATFTSNSNTDVTADITVPTKISQLENDMGFGTGGDTSDCVHKTGDETIAGVKTFTASPFVSNYAATNGYFTKLNIIGRNEVPSQIYHSAFRVFDKNAKTLGEYCVEKSTSGSSLLHMDVHTEDSEGNDIMESLYLNLSNDGSTVSFHPAKNNRTDLGMSNYKWAKIYSDDVVHTSGNETIAGFKSFTEVLDRRNDVTMSTVATATQLVDTNANRCGWIANRMHWSGNYHVHNRHIAYNENSGKEVYIDIISSNDGSGGLFVNGSATNRNLADATSATDHTALATMGWVNNPETSTNVVHRTGNEYIGGVKHFYNAIYSYQSVNCLNDAIDANTTPTSTIQSNIYFKDKNYQTISYIQYAHNPNGIHHLGCFLQDTANNLYGVVVNSDKEFHPYGDNTYSLGKSNMRWANVYATTFNGNLKGNADTATKSSYLDNYSVPSMNKIYLDWDKQVTGYVGLKVDNTTMGGLITTKNIGSQAANSATYSTTPATTDNSTRIATTAWVRNYVNSVAGSNTVGSSVSAYWSNSSNVTATGQTSASGTYPAGYSDYITKTPTVGTIYSGSQLYTKLAPYANATASTTGQGGSIKVTNITAQATFSNPISSTGKYLCTTANAVKFRAYVTAGNSSSLGTASVVDNSSTKSIFIRVE